MYQCSLLWCNLLEWLSWKRDKLLLLRTNVDMSSLWVNNNNPTTTFFKDSWVNTIYSTSETKSHPLKDKWGALSLWSLSLVKGTKFANSVCSLSCAKSKRSLSKMICLKLRPHRKKKIANAIIIRSKYSIDKIIAFGKRYPFWKISIWYTYPSPSCMWGDTTILLRKNIWWSAVGK